MTRGMIIELSHDVLGKLLQLPEGASVDSVRDDICRPGVIRARIAGMGPELREGEFLPVVKGSVTFVQAPVIDWDTHWETPR